MGLITLLLLLAFFAWLAVLVDRRIQERKQARGITGDTETTTDARLHPNGRVRQPKEKVRTFRAWAVTTFAAQPTLQQWLAALSDEAILLLNSKLTEFCTDMGFEFGWLLDHTVDQDNVLAPRLQGIAVQYIEVCYQAYMTQADVKAFQTWQMFMQHPYHKEQQALAHRVLTQLLDQDLLPAAAQSLLAAPEKEREVYIVQAIREAAEKHPDTFRAVWKDVVNQADGATLTTEPAIDRLKRVWQRRTAAEEQPATTPASTTA